MEKIIHYNVIFISLLFYITILYNYAKSLRKGNVFNPALWLIGGLIYFYITPLQFMIIYGYYSAPYFPLVFDINNVELYYYYFIIYAIVLLLIFCIEIRFVKTQKYKTDELKIYTTSGNYLYLLSTLLISIFLIRIVMMGGFTIYFSTYWAERSAVFSNIIGSTSGLFIDFLIGGLEIILVGIFLLHNYYSIILRGKLLSKPNIFFFLTILVILILSGNRIGIVWSFLGYIIISIRLKQTRIFKIGLLLCPLFLLIASLWPFVRGSITDPYQLLTNINNYFANQNTDDMIFFIIISIFEPATVLVLIETFNSFEMNDYLLGASMYGGLFKNFGIIDYTTSNNISLILAERLLPGEQGSLPPGIIGELYANFGILGILLLLPLIIVLSEFSRSKFSSTTSGRLLLCSASVFFLAFIRFPVSSSIGYIIIFSIIVTIRLLYISLLKLR